MTMDVQVNEAHTPPEGVVAVVLGRTPELSRREIESTLGRAHASISSLNVTSGVALVKASPTPSKQWFHRLGGSVKFGRVLAEAQPDPAHLVEVMGSVVGALRDVGLSALGERVPLLDLGKALKRAKRAKRFVLPTSGTLLTAAQSKQLRGDADREFLILASSTAWTLIEVTAVQDIDEQTRRDREAPEAHARRGMLPTKLARTMVNLGLGLVSEIGSPRVLDPFAGTGRVLMEARLLGLSVAGADIDPVAVKATIRNLDWLDETYRLEATDWTERIIQSPVAELARHLGSNAADLIITEPFLGPPQRHALSDEEIRRLFHDLRPLYLDLFRASQTLLAPTGGLVVVFPVVGTQSLLAEIVDNLPGLGYHVVDSIRVTRPDQVISRDVVMLRSSHGA